MRNRNLLLIGVVAAILAAILAVPVADAAPLGTMASVKTVVTKVLSRGDYCSLWVQKGLNGTVLEESGPVCSLGKGGRITINYTVDYRSACDWRGRNCRKQIVYVYDNAYPGW